MPFIEIRQYQFVRPEDVREDDRRIDPEHLDWDTVAQNFISFVEGCEEIAVDVEVPEEYRAEARRLAAVNREFMRTDERTILISRPVHREDDDPDLVR